LPRVTFVLPDRVMQDLDAAIGMSLLEVARANGIDIEGACGGSMACATCHLHVDEAWIDRLDPPTAEEDDMLDLAESLAATSRLGCQIRMRADLDGLCVRVPRTTLLSG
jgi:2Fe-2S ferredoxin